MQPSDRQRCRCGDLGSGSRLVADELELHGGTGEKAVRPIEHAQLQQLDAVARSRASCGMTVSILSPPVTSAPSPTELQRLAAARQDAFLDELRGLVNIDCGSYTRDGVNQVADVCADALRGLGAIGRARPSRARSWATW